MMIQTIALEDVTDPDLNPKFNPFDPFFESEAGLETIQIAKKKLEWYQDSESFRKTLTFCLLAKWIPHLKPDTALIISSPKLGKYPVTALVMKIWTEKGGVLVKVKARMR